MAMAATRALLPSSRRREEEEKEEEEVWGTGEVPVVGTGADARAEKTSLPGTAASPTGIEVIEVIRGDRASERVRACA